MNRSNQFKLVQNEIARIITRARRDDDRIRDLERQCFNANVQIGRLEKRVSELESAIESEEEIEQVSDAYKCHGD